MQEIQGDAKTIRALLSGSKYAIDYYQREYRWEQKQIVELIDDLAEQFVESFEPTHDRSEVANYGHYFLGSIIISIKEGRKFIIDGQQRLTSLTLLLMQIYRRLESDEQKTQLAELIFSQKYGVRSFNLDVPERNACMEALFSGEPFDEQDQPESVVNILDRFNDIDEHLPDEVCGVGLPYFADWLIENVHLVEITAFSDADAYTIFETMNDRGLSLTATDMLKGYLLANITETEKRTSASKIWRKHITNLQDRTKDEDADAIKAWLRGRHAQSMRERRRDAKAKDFELIGTEFHRWVKDREESLGLQGSDSFFKFVEKDFAFYAYWYDQIRAASEELKPGLEAIHFNAQNSFTLQYPTLLAALVPGDSEETIQRKLRIVASYLDILVTRRIWNWKSTSYSAMQYNIFQLVILKIRGNSPAEIAEILTDRLHSEEETFAGNTRFRLHGMNGKQIHRLLARMTDFVETKSGRPSRYAEYIVRGGKKGYEVEHIWADHPERHVDEFDHPADFSEHRNRIGGLLLLPKKFNASYGDKTYEDKRDHYYGQNLLAQSLHENAYSHDPGFKSFIQMSGLPFKAHAEFASTDLDDRQQLYGRLAELIWSPSILVDIANQST